jgi:hypothetical protein
MLISLISHIHRSGAPLRNLSCLGTLFPASLLLQSAYRHARGRNLYSHQNSLGLHLVECLLGCGAYVYGRFVIVSRKFVIRIRRNVVFCNYMLLILGKTIA